MREVRTFSQICNLAYLHESDNIITTHGFADGDESLHNKIAIWDSKTLKKKTILSGHIQRVIYLTVNNNGRIAVTGSSDETLRFWRLNNEKERFEP